MMLHLPGKAIINEYGISMIKFSWEVGMRLRFRNMEKEKSIFLINTITKENSLTTKDKAMELCFFE
jgi:hypothetical protein